MEKKKIRTSKLQKLLMILVLICILGSGILIVNAADGDILFDDNFEDGDITDWTITGTGTVEQILDDSVNTTQVFRLYSSSNGYAIAGDELTDFSFEAHVKPVASDSVGAIIFRVQNTSNFYMFRIYYKTGRAELYKVKGGSAALLAYGGNFTAQKWYKYGIIVKDNKITGYIDDEKVLTYTDENSPFTSGKIGMRSGKTTYYDNIVVRSPDLAVDTVTFKDGNTEGSVASLSDVTTDPVTGLKSVIGTVSFYNPTTNPKTASIIIALYDGNMLQDVQYVENINILAGAVAQEENVTINIPSDVTEHSVKIFKWIDMNNMQPLARANILPDISE